jgi:hypothetical protein
LFFFFCFLKLQIGDLTATKAASEKKLKDFEASSAAQIEKLRLRRHELEEENEKLKASVAARRSEEIARLEDLAENERAKSARMEVEHNLLQREAAKKEVRIRGLQRDMMRLQSALSAANTEISKLRDRETELLATSTSYAPSSSGSSSPDPEKDSLKQENERLRQRIAALESSMLDGKTPIANSTSTAVAVGSQEADQLTVIEPPLEAGEDKETAFRKVREHMATTRAAILSSLAPGGFAGASGSGDGSGIGAPSSQDAASSPSAPEEGRSLPERQGHDSTGRTPAPFPSSSSASSSASSTGISRSGYGPDIYAAQLSKLLRLAEEAIGKG